MHLSLEPAIENREHEKISLIIMEKWKSIRLAVAAVAAPLFLLLLLLLLLSLSSLIGPDETVNTTNEPVCRDWSDKT